MQCRFLSGVGLGEYGRITKLHVKPHRHQFAQDKLFFALIRFKEKAPGRFMIRGIRVCPMGQQVGVGG